MGNVLDLFGIKQIYQRAPGGRLWFLKNTPDEIMNDPLVELNEGVLGNATDGFHLDDNSQVRFSVFPSEDNVQLKADSDPDMDQSEAKARDYMFKPGDWMMFEMGGRFKMTQVPSGDDGSLTLKGPTGRHSTPEPWCDGTDYVARLFCANSGG